MEKIKKYIYIAHPISKSDPALNMHNLVNAMEEVHKLGHYVYGAFCNLFWEAQFPKPYKQYIAHDIAWMKKCDIVWRIPGESKGADIETQKAIELGIPVVYSLSELKKLLK